MFGLVLIIQPPLFLRFQTKFICEILCFKKTETKRAGMSFRVSSCVAPSLNEERQTTERQQPLGKFCEQN